MTDTPAVRVGGATRTVGVIGWPVDHSLSPVIHNAAFAAMGIDWISIPMPVAPGDVAAALEGLAALGFAGANVTMPHKTDVADLVLRLSDDAGRLRAVNTVVVRPDGLEGHNTDAPGFDLFLRRDAGFDAAGKTAVVFGAGGAARACSLSLARAGLARLVVALRDPSHDAALRATVAGFATEIATVSFDDASSQAADLFVNATPLGRGGEALPDVPLGAGLLVVDLLYRPVLTPLLRRARASGATAFGGLGLLLQQAALSLELWTGQVPPLEVMSAAATAWLLDRD